MGGGLFCLTNTRKFAKISRPMRIAMIGMKGVPSNLGGIETHVTKLSSRLAGFGYEVIAYVRSWHTPRSAGAFYDGVRLVRLPSIHTKNLDAITHTFLAVVHALFISRPDIYHFHGVGPSLLAWMPRVFAPKARVVSTFHCLDRNHGKWGQFAKFMLRLGEWASCAFAHNTIVISKNLRTYVQLEYGCAATFIPYGVTSQPGTVDSLLLQPFGLEPYRYIAMVSRLVPHKSAHTLIRAWQKARTKRPDVLGDMKLALIGGSSFTDAYVASLRNMAQDDRSIVFTDFQGGDTLRALFQGASFIAHPSLSEGFSISILEAMSYGKAVLAADIPENMEAVRDHGVHFEAGNEDDLTQKIIELAADPMRAAAIGHVARAYVEHDHNWDDVARKTAAVYECIPREIPQGVLAVR